MVATSRAAAPHRMPLPHLNQPLVSYWRRACWRSTRLVVTTYGNLQSSGASGSGSMQAALYASLCLRFWSEFRGIPPREPLTCFRRKRKKEKDTPKRRERAKQGASPRHATPLSSRCCTAVSLPFLPVPVLSCVGASWDACFTVGPRRPRTRWLAALAFAGPRGRGGCGCAR